MEKPYAIEGIGGKNVLVLGGLGFLGSNTARKCLELGANVTVFDAMLGPFGANPANVRDIKGRIKIVKKDMRDKEALSKAVRGMDLIFNCAGQASHSDSMKDPFFDVDLNIIANLNLLESCRKFNDAARIVYAGTRAETGKAVFLPVTETHPDNPNDIYGVSKLAAEKYMFVYNQAYGMQGVSVRLTATFGPRHQMKHNRYGILNWFIRLALENKKIPVFGDGSQLRDYTYVDDAVDAMLLAAAKSRANGQVYFLGSDRPVKFIEMVRLVVKECGSGSIELVPFPPEKKMIEVWDFSGSFGKIKNELGWVPVTPFEEGMKKTVEFYKKNRADYF